MRNGFRSIGVTLAVIAIGAVAAPLAGGASGETNSTDRCEPRSPGVQCGSGNGRRTAGGGDTGNVPHTDERGRRWPAVSGILWKVLDSADRTKLGGPLNDELLGHHGDEELNGGAGHDILWGDWDPRGNTGRQRDILRGGEGNDWIYSSHGRNTLLGGPGRDYLYAFYGRGVVDCGPGRNDTARVRLNGAYEVRNCETIRNFCAFGNRPDGGCYKPGEKPKGRR